jgi:hypothetical protein
MIIFNHEIIYLPKELSEGVRLSQQETRLLRRSITLKRSSFLIILSNVLWLS